MYWTKEQIKTLKDNYSLRGKKWCIRKLNLKEHQIRYKASALGLKIDHNSNLLNYNNSSKYKGVKRPDHSIRMKKLVKDGRIKVCLKRDVEKYITECIICNKKIEFILPENTTIKPRLRKTCSDKCSNLLNSKSSKDYHKNNEHPRGMLGKTHSQKFKNKMSIRVKNQWANPDSYIKSDKNRQRISDANVILHKKGILGGNTSYSNCKRGWFIDGDKKYFMRSGWELRYAAYLNILKNGSVIKDWEYEVDTFWFNEIKRGVRSYKPDFKIWYDKSNFEYHEVKGRMDAKSKTKLSRMKKYYPNITVVLKDALFFKNNKQIIPSYEFAIKNYSK